MDANQWPQQWVPFDDRNTFNQFSGVNGNPSTYHGPTLNGYTELIDARSGLAIENALAVPANYPVIQHPLQATTNISALRTSFYNIPPATASPIHNIGSFTGPSHTRQTLNNTISSVNAYGALLPENVINEQGWLSNPSPITGQPNLVHSPLPMHDCQSNTTQHSPATPCGSHRVETSPNGQPMRKTTRFSSYQRNTLQAWYNQHQDDTYASDEDLSMLQAATGLDARQVRAWLSRARRKEPIIPPLQLTVDASNKTKPVAAVSNVRAVGMTAAAPIRAADEYVSDDVVISSLEVVPSSTRASSTDHEPEDADGWITDEDMRTFVLDTLETSPNSVLHWWMNSLPNNTWDHPEPSALKSLTPPHVLPHPSQSDRMDIEERGDAQKMAKLSTQQNEEQGSHGPTSFETYDRSFLNPNHIYQSMDDSIDNSASSEFGRSMIARSVTTRGSGNSGHTTQSTNSGFSLESRKGRRRMQRQYHKHHVSEGGKSDDSLTGANECPVCHKAFSCKSSCKRHVQSVHAPSVVWVCGPTTPTHTGELEGRPSTCSFCSQQNCQHKLVECWSKPAQSRTFYRRDHFRQHLVGTHKVNPELVSGLNLSAWERAHPISPHTVHS